MPYIKQRDRLRIATDATPISAGDLNYMITALITEYLGRKELNYQKINECIGVLECAKLELYRRIAAPYEDQKIQENGDVYP